MGNKLTTPSSWEKPPTTIHGLVYGKVSYAIANIAIPRLHGNIAKATNDFGSVQVAINDVARTLKGIRRTDRITIPDLLTRAGINSINAVAVQAVDNATF